MFYKQQFGLDRLAEREISVDGTLVEINESQRVDSTRRVAYSTEELAELARLKPNSIRSSLCRLGHWEGLRPVKLVSRRLLWDATEVARVLKGETLELRGCDSSSELLIDQTKGAGNDE